MDAAGFRLLTILQKDCPGLLEYLAGVFSDIVLDVCSGTDGNYGCRRRRPGIVNPATYGGRRTCGTGPHNGGIFYDYHRLSGRILCDLFYDEYFAKVQFKNDSVGSRYYFNIGGSGFSDGTV